MFNGDQERTAREMLNPRNSHEAFQRAHGLSVSLSMLPLRKVRVVSRDHQRSIFQRLESLWRNRTASVPLPLGRQLADTVAEQLC